MVQIREMETSDYDEAYLLWESVPGMGLNTLDNSQTGITKLLQKNPGLCFVAIVDKKIVGTILGVTDGRKGYLYHVAVSKDYQGQHISKQLIELVKQKFKAQGIQKIGIFIMNDNQNGKDFWKHQGFDKRKDIEYFDLNL
jgi:Acetyltransferases